MASMLERGAGGHVDQRYPLFVFVGTSKSAIEEKFSIELLDDDDVHIGAIIKPAHRLVLPEPSGVHVARLLRSLFDESKLVLRYGVSSERTHDEGAWLYVASDVLHAPTDKPFAHAHAILHAVKTLVDEEDDDDDEDVRRCMLPSYVKKAVEKLNKK
eukprot:TRINITY_DN5190_c0_g1_i1.p1 TRINITY_DN5190_c0_g1~~TRINITY_DN5190_c0_g1_i1.p1  ORF type:complete len:157 (+),score=55.78 TRINITY_DN5190_c0_g1_i1:311-781(+)